MHNTWGLACSRQCCHLSLVRSSADEWQGNLIVCVDLLLDYVVIYEIIGLESTSHMYTLANLCL